MVSLVFLLGLVCVVYTTVELSLAAASPFGRQHFGAVDATSGRPVDVVVDRRDAGRPGSRPVQRRRDD